MKDESLKKVFELYASADEETRNNILNILTNEEIKNMLRKFASWDKAKQQELMDKLDKALQKKKQKEIFQKKINNNDIIPIDDLKDLDADDLTNFPPATIIINGKSFHVTTWLRPQ